MHILNIFLNLISSIKKKKFYIPLTIFLVIIGSILFIFRSFLPFFPVLFQKGTIVVTLHNNAEMRPTLGFLTGFFLIKNEKDEIGLEFHDSYNIADPINTKASPEIFEKRFGTTKEWKGLLFRDSNISFSFPENAQNAIFFLKEDSRFKDLHYKAVIGIDMQAIGNIIDSIGGILFQDTTLTSENLFSILSEQSRQFIPLTKEDWLHRKSGLSDISSSLIKTFIFSPWKWNKVSKSFKKSLDTQHILLWFANPKVQEVAKYKKWTGELIQKHSSFAIPYGHFYTNLGGKKSDRYIQKNTTSVFSIDDFGNIIETIHFDFFHNGTRNVFSDRYFAEVAIIRTEGVKIKSSKGIFEYAPKSYNDGTIRFFFWVNQNNATSFDISLAYPPEYTMSFISPLIILPLHQPGTDDTKIHSQIIFQGSGQSKFLLEGCMNIWNSENVSSCILDPFNTIFSQWKEDISSPFLEELIWQDNRKSLRIQISEKIGEVINPSITLTKSDTVIKNFSIKQEEMAIILSFQEPLPISNDEKYQISLSLSDLFGNEGVIKGAIR